MGVAFFLTISGWRYDENGKHVGGVAKLKIPFLPIIKKQKKLSHFCVQYHLGRFTSGGQYKVVVCPTSSHHSFPSPFLLDHISGLFAKTGWSTKIQNGLFAKKKPGFLGFFFGQMPSVPPCSCRGQYKIRDFTGNTFSATCVNSEAGFPHFSWEIRVFAILPIISIRYLTKN